MQRLTTPPALALFRRDFVDELRRGRSFVLAVVAVGLSILVVLIEWPRAGATFLSVASTARTLFEEFGLIHLWAASVIPPGLAALAFAAERRQDTLDQLRLSLVSTPGLILAKLTASVGLVALLFVATLPALGAQMLLVGVSTFEVLALPAVVFCTAFMTASVGLLCGVLFRRSPVLMIMSYLGTALAMGGWLLVLVAVWFLLRVILGENTVDGFIETAVGWPVVFWLLQFFEDAIVAPYDHLWGSTRFAQILWAALGYRTTIGLLCLLWAFRILRRPEKPLRVPKERPIDDAEILWKRRHRFPYYLVDPLRRRDLIGDEANPVLVREVRHGLGVRLQTGFRMFVATALTATLLGLWWAFPSWGMLFDHEGVLQGGMISATLIAAVVVQIVAANVMTKEREQGNLDMLRMTLLTPYEFLIGKLAAGFIALSPFLLAVLAAAIPMALMAQMVDQGCVTMLLYGLALLLCCAWLSFCIAFTTSVHAKTTLQSLVWGFLLNAVVYGAPPLLTIVFSSFNWYLRLPEVLDWQRKLIEVSPLASYYGIHSTKTPDYLSYMHLNPKENLLTSLPIVVIAGFVLLAVAYQRLKALEEPDEE
jgi:ABC-type transport system involved in multi-copper enzyme maturation permease subunit